jgi:hypothetical protein
MADPICRWRNPYVSTIIELVKILPHEVMSSDKYREIVEKRWPGFLRTPYQLACQVGLYYESDDGMYYPRFDHDIDETEAFSYMKKWITRYYVPNPYTKSMKNLQQPQPFLASIISYIYEHPDEKGLHPILEAVFQEKIGNIDIVSNVLNTYTDLIKVDTLGNVELTIKAIDFMKQYIDRNDKKAFFEYFSESENEIDNNLSKNLIFYGAPGTGKSNTIKRDVDDKGLPNIRTTFHPDTDYSTFVGAYKPTTIEVPMMTMVGTKALPVENPDGTPRKEKKIVYEFVPQAFLKAYTGAWKNQDRPFFLIIEEINRGNCAQIFGDLFQLLDRKNGESEYPISPDEDIQKFLRTDKKYGFASLTDEQKAAIPEDVLTGEMMILPKNLYIWSTMNTSDQSLFPIDSAFKRRWDWKYVPIANANKNWRIKADGLLFDWWDFLEKVNAVIGTTTNSEDKKLGYFFCKPAGRIIDAETFVGKVVFYLWNDVFKDFEFEGDVFKDVDGKLSFNKFYDVNDQGDTVIKEDKVVLFLNNLGVEEIEDDIDYSSEGNDNDKDGSFSVRYDGEPIEGKSAIDIFATVIEAAGVGRIAEMGLAVGGHPLLSKDKLDENVMGGYGKGQRKIGDYWMITKFSNSQKKTFLNKIKAQFDLNIEID